MPWRVLRKARLRDPWPSETCRLSFDTSTPKYSMAHSWRELGLDWVERSPETPGGATLSMRAHQAQDTVRALPGAEGDLSELRAFKPKSDNGLCSAHLPFNIQE